jgi:UDP-2-acetamido-2-deoxy-ribo-hexuluronate aminotransferase
MMEFIDLRAQHAKISQNLNERMQRVIQHGKFIMGPEVDELEKKLSAFCGVKHAIACANGTDALQVAMMAVGVKPGDEVITTAFSFFATVETIMLLGAKPVFVDIDPDTYNIDPKKIEAAITPKTKVIVGVSLYGQCFDLEAVSAIAKRHKILLFEDAAQSFGASQNGRKSCSFADISCTSFFPSKPLGCYGDGGALFTNNDRWAEAMKQIRVHGQDRRYHHIRLGVNSRLDTLQAAVLLAKLEIFDREIQLRQEVAARYTAALSGIVKTPTVRPGNVSAWAQYTIEVDQRERVQKMMNELGVPTTVHYPHPMHNQPAVLESFGDPQPMPVAESASARVLSIPMHPYLTDGDQVRVIEAIKSALRA